MNQKKRPIGITLLAIFAGFAALFAVVHTLQLLHLLPIPGPFGIVKFFAFDFVGALMWGILAAIYIWVAKMLWSVDARGWLFVVVVAIFNLVIIGVDLIGGSTWESLLPSILVNGLILIYCLLPGTKEAFIPQPTADTAPPAPKPAPAPEAEPVATAVVENVDIESETAVVAAAIAAAKTTPSEETPAEIKPVPEPEPESEPILEESEPVAAVVENVDIESETAVAAAAIAATQTIEPEETIEEPAPEPVVEELVVEEVVVESAVAEEETEIVASVVENVDIEAETAVAAAAIAADIEESKPTTADIVEETAHSSPGETAKLTTAADFIEGIGPVYSKKLQEVGIDSPKSLLEAAATPKGRAELEEKTGISHKLIMKWLQAADLYRIKGIGTQYAELLVTAGVNTVLELAQRNPENLHQTLIEVNEEKQHVREVPSQNMVTSWVEQAKELPRVISY